MRSRWQGLVTFIFIVMILWLSIDTFRISRQGNLNLSRPANPIFMGFQKIKSFFSALDQALELKSEVNDLKSENIRLKADLVNLKEDYNDLVRLGKELELLSGSFTDFNLLVSARVVGKSPLRFFDIIKIDVGASDSVSPGDIVLASGFLVGIVETVGKNLSEVKLITDNNLKLPVILQESRAQGLLSGSLEGLIVGDIAADKAIKDDEPVLTSSLADFVPGGIPVGFIDTELSSESAVVQRFRVSSPVNFDDLELVLILKNEN